MSRLTKIALSTSLALAVGIGASACADNDSSLFIEGVLLPEPPECGVTFDPGSTMLGRDSLDVAFSLEYNAWLLVGNQFAPRGDKDRLRTETSRVVLRGAEVILEDASGAQLDTFSVPGAGFAHPDQGSDPGYGGLLATLIPQRAGLNLRDSLAEIGAGASQTVVARVRAFGDTLGGEELTSAEYSFPIDVCLGCSIMYPLEAIDRTTSTPQCTAQADGVGDPPCFQGQGVVDCRLCAATNPLCLNVPGG